MTQKLQTYPKYKPSGIDGSASLTTSWLGDIPTEWETKRNLGLFSERKERVKHFADEEFELLSVTIGQGVVRQAELAEIEERKDSSNEDKSNYKRVRKGDIAYNKMRMWQGAAGESKYDGIVSPAYIILKPKPGILPRYFHYFFRTEVFNEVAYQYGYGIADDQHSLRYRQFKALYSPLPPLETQKQIAYFLDEKTKIIDELVAKKEKLIELLREKRAALITRAVTKGIDPNAKLKPSGVDWLGDIPEEWEVRRGKFIFRYKKEPNNSYQCDHILALTLKGVINKEDYEARSLTPTDYASYQVFYPDDLVFKLIDLENFQTSRVGIVPEKGIMSPAYLRIVPVAKITPRFFYWFYYSLYLQGIFNFLGVGVRSTLNQHDLLAQSVTLPSPQEQKRIADFLDVETTTIDKATALIESQIEKLKEYLSSLIYHAVTGRIKI